MKRSRYSENNNNNIVEKAIENIISNKDPFVEFEEFTEEEKQLIDVEKAKEEILKREVSLLSFDEVIDQFDNMNIQSSPLKPSKLFKYKGGDKAVISITIELDESTVSQGRSEYIEVYLSDLINESSFMKESIVSQYDFTKMMIHTASIDNLEYECSEPFAIGSSIQETICDYMENYIAIAKEGESVKSSTQLEFDYSDGDDSDDEEFEPAEKERKFFLFVEPDSEYKKCVFRRPVYLTDVTYTDVFGGIDEESLTNGVIDNGDTVLVPEQLSLALFYKRNTKKLYSKIFVNPSTIDSANTRYLCMNKELYETVKDDMYDKMISYIPYESFNDMTLFFKTYGDSDQEPTTLKLNFDLELTFSIWKKNKTNIACIRNEGIGEFFDIVYTRKDGKIYPIDSTDLRRELMYMRDKKKTSKKSKSNKKRRKRQKNK